MLITHGLVATLGKENRVVENGAVMIEDDKIIEVGATADLKVNYPQAQEFDAGGMLVLPGAICAHTHFYGAFARGMYIPGAPASNFVQILEKLWWRLDLALDAEGNRLSALVCLMDAIRHGTTTLVDHHASPNAIEGSLDALAEAVIESGLRACLCYEVTDRNGDEGAKAGIAENVRFARKLMMDPSPHLKAMFGLHAAFTVSDRTLEHAVAEARMLGVGFHTHLAEDAADEDDSLRNYGVRIARRFLQRGVLDHNTICAHGVHLDESELRHLAKAGAKLTHQPRSNMNNAVGVAPVQQALDLGVCVGLGNDGFSNDHFAEMKAAYLVHKIHQRDPRVMAGDTVMRMAYENNTRIARECAGWPEPLGELTPGAYADLMLLDYRPYTPLTADNLPWQIIFGVDGAHVNTTIVGGRVLMRDHKLLTLDEERIAAQAREYASKIWKRFTDLSSNGDRE
jgi:putative selenium metabolism protein SsnA